MSIAPIPPSVPGIGPVGSTGPASTTQAPQQGGFASAVERGLQSVSSLEHQADAAIQDVATGGETSIHELMTATAKAQLGVEVLAQVRDRAVEAYQEIMRMQV